MQNSWDALPKEIESGTSRLLHAWPKNRTCVEHVLLDKELAHTAETKGERKAHGSEHHMQWEIPCLTLAQSPVWLFLLDPHPPNPPAPGPRGGMGRAVGEAAVDVVSRASGQRCDR
ncbi:hypothetical protein SORBI_3009G091900 [Sorghum bicolor]|uniref:Uncharacterized protein n=2 Tax=Sorghum bicolor TaxID=4558 RepID=A0A1Z5R1P2_SORBI|nr:hypothetical protein SORBI_3009G091900 [Sorghum bicolor]